MQPNEGVNQSRNHLAEHDLEAILDERGVEETNTALDLELMRGVAAGDQSCLIKLWTNHQDVASRVLTKRASTLNLWSRLGRDVAEDLIADALTGAYEDIVKDPTWWKPKKGWSLKTYFCTRALQVFERLSKQQIRRAEELPSRVYLSGFRQPREEDNPERILLRESEQEQLASQVLSIIEGLPNKLRDTIVLRYWGDMPMKEVARSLSISESAAKQRIYRAKSRIKKELTSRGQEIG